MIELPEAYVLAGQINDNLVGKTIKSAVANASPHAFAMYTGDPAAYDGKLSGKKITGAAKPDAGYTCGGNVEINCGDMVLVITTPIKYHAPKAKFPPKHQLLIQFDDLSHISCTVQMWGCMYCMTTEEAAKPGSFYTERKPDPLTDEFDAAYFDLLWNAVKPNISVKAFLATEQRIPGLGNGVLQDILWNARIHPKKKLQDITGAEKEQLFHSVKTTLLAMREQGGRDTERDLYGQKGGYKTVLSSKTIKNPCPACGDMITREAYLGGNIYYCFGCQKL